LKARQAKVSEAVLDLGMVTPVHGSTPFAVLKGAVDSGLKIPHDPEAFPKEDRIKGKHIVDFAAKLSPEQLNKKFSAELKQGFNPKDLTALFEKTKQALAQEFKVKA
jgi:large subunit ribosomal protein L18